MDEKELFDAAAVAVAEVTRDGEKYFRGAVQRAGLVLTKNLYDSVESLVITEATGLGMEVHFTFAEYWRYNDMKQLEFAAVPNIDKMKKWVDKIPANQIPWVNGYEGVSTSTVINKIGEAKVRERFLNSVLAHRKRIPIVVHENRRRLYNKTKAAYVNVLRGRLMKALGKRVPIFVSENMGGVRV